MYQLHITLTHYPMESGHVSKNTLSKPKTTEITSNRGSGTTLGVKMRNQYLDIKATARHRTMLNQTLPYLSNCNCGVLLILAEYLLKSFFG